jgi:hypothetical protein
MVWGRHRGTCYSLFGSVKECMGMEDSGVRTTGTSLRLKETSANQQVVSELVGRQMEKPHDTPLQPSAEKRGG